LYTWAYCAADELLTVTEHVHAPYTITAVSLRLTVASTGVDQVH